MTHIDDDINWPEKLNSMIMLNTPIDKGAWRRRFTNHITELQFQLPDVKPPNIDELHLPTQLQSFTINGPWNQSLTAFQIHQLCPLLQKIDLTLLTISFDNPFMGVQWPPQLTTLVLPDEFNQPLTSSTWTAPPSLIELTLGEYWNQSVDDLILPNSLQILQFGTFFNQPIDGLRLPESLVELHFGRVDMHFYNTMNWITHFQPDVQHSTQRFSQSLRDLKWPSHLRILTIINSKFDPNQSGLLPPNHNPLPASLHEFQLARVANDEFAASWRMIPLPSNCRRTFFDIRDPRCYSAVLNVQL